jgi:putative FmdB family regulatory protein
MPTYEYECQACGDRHDVFQRMSDDPLVDCPSCSEPALKKLLSAPAFQLKGTGWYQTDFKNNAKKETAKDSSGGDSAAAGSEGGKETGQKDSGEKVAASGCAGGGCACH